MLPVADSALAEWKFSTPPMQEVFTALKSAVNNSLHYFNPSAPLHLGHPQHENAWNWLKTYNGERFLDDEKQAIAMFPPSQTWLEEIISATSPRAMAQTNCPICGFSPTHGAYYWHPLHPGEMTCRGCGITFPHPDYPEDIILQSCWDPAQSFGYISKKPWVNRGGRDGPITVCASFSGYLRSRSTDFAAKLCYRSAILFFLTGEPEWAQVTRRILLRFAEVYPRYLIHNALGQIVDMDPEEAPFIFNNLPESILSVPPNVPVNYLHKGIWNAGRAFYGGIEGHWMMRVAGAYDLTRAATLAGQPLYSGVEHHLIQKNILINGLPLLICDQEINNKAGCRLGAVCMIGALLGRDQLVSYALDGFMRAIKEWFLADGTTPESSGYATMMLHGLWRIPEILLNYKGHDLFANQLNLYNWLPYERVLRRLMEAALPNGQYPLVDDNRHPALRSPILASLAAQRYQWAAHGLAPDVAACRQFPAHGRIAQFWYGGYHPIIPLFYSPLSEPTHKFLPVREHEVSPVGKSVMLHSHTSESSEYLRISVPPARSHRHKDHLNLIWGDENQEFLSDLGYLWDMANYQHHTTDTAAHNLVVVDEMNQRTQGRDGDIILYHNSPGLSVARLRSNAYAQCQVYERCIVRLGHMNQGILADFFWVQGGETYQWLMHGPVAGEPTGTISFPTSSNMFMHVTYPSDEREHTYIAKGWGQRGARDAGATLPYLCRQVKSNGQTYLFATAYALSENMEFTPFTASLQYDPNGSGLLVVHAGDSRFAIQCASPTVVEPLLTSTSPVGYLRFANSYQYEGWRLEGLCNYLQWDKGELVSKGTIGGNLYDNTKPQQQYPPHALRITIDSISSSTDETILHCRPIEGDSPQGQLVLYCQVEGRVVPYPILRMDADADSWRVCIQKGSLGHQVQASCKDAYILGGSYHA